MVIDSSGLDSYIIGYYRVADPRKSNTFMFFKWLQFIKLTVDYIR